MGTFRFIGLGLIAALLPLVTACVDSVHPLSDEKTSTIDERLIGRWEGDSEYIVAKTPEHPNALSLMIRERNGSETKGLVYATRIKDKSCLTLVNLKEEAKEGEKPEKTDAEPNYCMIVQYTFSDDDTLVARAMDPKTLIKAIETKALAGEMRVDERGRKSLVLTAASDELRRYLEDHADEVYPANSSFHAEFKRKK